MNNMSLCFLFIEYMVIYFVNSSTELEKDHQIYSWESFG